MRLPEDVESVLKARGEKAAVSQLCRQHKMTRAAATAWVSACDDRGLRVADNPLNNGKIALLLMAAFLTGMLIAALQKLF
ncbi:hypothetical protein [Alcanivorax sp.]|uniref:hypothetical protein n=1 Tax=Alcanivorax sp. TaxID=1872427 RepID=UPI0025C1D0C6|nr:hypothetical protein [Alcanivorax sp.]